MPQYICFTCFSLKHIIHLTEINTYPYAHTQDSELTMSITPFRYLPLETSQKGGKMEFHLLFPFNHYCSSEIRNLFNVRILFALKENCFTIKIFFWAPCLLLCFVWDIKFSLEKLALGRSWLSIVLISFICYLVLFRLRSFCSWIWLLMEK
jgi:hypothetical protein